MLKTEKSICVEVPNGTVLGGIIKKLNKQLKKCKIKSGYAKINVHFVDGDNKTTLSRKADAVVLAHEVARATGLIFTNIDFSYARPNLNQDKAEVYLTISRERQ